MTSPANKNKPANQNEGIRPGVLVAVVVVLACLVGGLVFWKKSPSSNPPQSSTSEGSSELSPGGVVAAPQDETVPVLVTNETPRPAAPARAQLTVKRAPPAAANPAPAPTPRPAPSPYTQMLVNNIVGMDKAGVPKTPEQIAAWKQGLKTLVQQGESALPAIQEYLEKNVDFALGGEGAQALGYSSTRAALYDALVQMGGAGAAGVLLGTLQTSADPRDIAALAQSLEQIAPEQYRQQILDTSREILSASGDAKANQTDLAVLFQVLDKYGGATVVADLQGLAANYKYYSAIALAQLPEGAGVPALIQLVSDTGGGQVKSIAALEALTQAAGQNSDARAALLTQANNISAYGWANLTAILSGDQIQFLDSASGSAPVTSNSSDLRTYHIASGNQNFYTAPAAGGMTADQIAQQNSLIDALLSATSNPAAVAALQNARNTLAKRSQTAAR